MTGKQKHNQILQHVLIFVITLYSAIATQPIPHLSQTSLSTLLQSMWGIHFIFYYLLLK